MYRCGPDNYAAIAGRRTDARAAHAADDTLYFLTSSMDSRGVSITPGGAIVGSDRRPERHCMLELLELLEHCELTGRLGAPNPPGRSRASCMEHCW